MVDNVNNVLQPLTDELNLLDKHIVAIRDKKDELLKDAEAIRDSKKQWYELEALVNQVKFNS